MDETRTETEGSLQAITDEISRTADHRSIARVYAAAQQRCPVQRMTMADGSVHWAVIGESELDAVLKDAATYSSAMEHFPGLRSIPIEMDPPEHTDFRRVLNRVVTPALAKTLEADTRRYIIDLLEPFIANGGGDIVPLAKSLPMRVLCRLIGVSDEDWPYIAESQSKLVASDMVLGSDEAAERRFGGLEPVIEYATKLIAARRLEPQDDVVSGLLSGVVQDRPITDQEVLQMMILLLLAGHETTGIALSGSTLLLATYPDVQQSLRNDPSKIPSAMEECLRVETPVQSLDRIAMRDVELAGQQIKAGDTLLTVFGAANVDPSGFADPQSFDPDRGANRHFTFGKGIHTCVGAPIARMELKLFFEELLARTDSFSLEEPYQRNRWPDLSATSLKIKTVASTRRAADHTQ